MLKYISEDTRFRKSRLFLCKPDTTTISELSFAYNRNFTFKYNGLHELTFEVPYSITKNHKKVRTPKIDMIRGHYLIRYELPAENEKLWFLIQQPKKSTSNGKSVLTVRCMLLPYELNRKLVRNYEEIKQLYAFVGTDGFLNETLLQQTDWSIDYIDADIAKKVRNFQISEETLLQVVTGLSEKFNCLIEWDTENKSLSIYKHELYGEKKGFNVGYGKYLKAITEEPNFDNVVTRLHLYGDKDISIQTLNATGTTYIDDFSYYMHPFQRDASKKVISHSYYMSDELCHAILDYQVLTSQYEGSFQKLLTQKQTAYENLDKRKNELFVLETELKLIEDELAVKNTNQENVSAIIIRKNNKVAQITAKKNQINTHTNEITKIDTDIRTIKNTIDAEKFFTKELHQELNLFINESIIIDSSFTDEKELLAFGKEKIKELNQPSISYNIDVVDFFSVADCHRDWDKAKIGNEIDIDYEELSISVKAKILGYTHNEDSNSLQMEIGNVYGKNNFMSMLTLYQEMVNATKTIDMSKYKWDMSEENNSTISQLINDIWDASKRRIVAGYEQSVIIDAKGISITSTDDPKNKVILQNGIVGLSNDSGNSWKNAITPYGIVGEVIIGKLLLGEKLIIADTNGHVLINGEGMTIKDTNEVQRVKLGKLGANKYGLKITSADGRNTVLDENGILQTLQVGGMDNVNSSKPLTLSIYMPDETISVKKAILRFRLMKFRAFSTGASSGGGTNTSTTSSSGGGTSYTTTSVSGGSAYVQATSSSGGGVTKSTEAENYSWSKGHNHGIPSGKSLATYPITKKSEGGGVYNVDYVVFSETAEHTHSVTIPSHSHDVNVYVPSHSHDVNVYIPSHNHDVNVYVPSHTHEIVYGIYEGTSASGISVFVNGYDRTTALGGKFYSDRHNLDVAPYLIKGQWNTIQLYSNQLGRLDASVFAQALLGYNE